MNPEAEKHRAYWVAELAKLSGSFSDDSTKLEDELRSEVSRDGLESLVQHLHLCGAIPEQYEHDSSAEKLYSKYTDAVVSETLSAIGLSSSLILTRADAADVQANCSDFSLVADAKAFRLSRTAKNQKDFKVQAMDGWRGGRDYAMVICPIYQLPGQTSQIYQQAIARNVCILSYTHLATLLRLVMRRSTSVGKKGLHAMLKSVSLLHPSKSATDYWVGINQALLKSLGSNVDLWTDEKTASFEALEIAKKESLTFLRFELDRLLRLSHKQAIEELVRSSGISSRIRFVENIEIGQLLNVTPNE
jgi:hypothetical protein